MEIDMEMKKANRTGKGLERSKHAVKDVSE